MLYGFVTEKERESKILQGPTKATLLLHLLYITWKTGSNTERWEPKKERKQARKSGERKG